MDESNDVETAVINYDTTTVVNKIKEKYVEFWRHKKTNSSKLSFLCTFKKDYKMEPYLYLIKNPTIRRTFTQFRISNHKLQIERGRYENIPREQRICKLCNSKTEIENEFHLVFTCEKYENIRNSSNNILKNLFNLNTTTESKQKLLEHVMSSDDSVLVNLLSKFISLCSIEREISLKSMELH